MTWRLSEANITRDLSIEYFIFEVALNLRENIRAKSLRSNNTTNVVKATFEGLKELRSVEEVAKIRGIDADKVLG